MRAISRQSLTDLVAEAIVQRLVAGELKPGDKLGEAQLAQELQVSRTPVREALQRLTTLGLLEKDTHRGAKVASLSPAQLVQVYEVREALEGLAARLFASRATSAAYDELERIWREMEQARRRADAAAVRVMDFELHRHLIRAGGNDYLAGGSHAEALMLLAYLVGRGGLDLGTTLATPPTQAPPDPHAELMAALLARDPEAAEAAMRAHVRTVRLRLLQELEMGEQQRLCPSQTTENED